MEKAIKIAPQDSPFLESPIIIPWSAGEASLHLHVPPLTSGIGLISPWIMQQACKKTVHASIVG